VKKVKLSFVAMAMLLSAGAVFAQGVGRETPERAPAAQQNAPAEKIAPPMKRDGESSSQTKSSPAPDGKAGNGHETTGQSSRSGAGEKPGVTDKDPSGAATGRSDPRSSTEQSGGSAKSIERGAEQNRTTTTGQGAAAGLARLSTEQRTKITSIIRQHKVEPTKLTVSVSVGTRLPESVRLYPLPAQVIEVYPEWRGLEYILVGNQIAVIDPRTHEIVAILEA
jgi:hypothetical protein